MGLHTLRWFLGVALMVMTVEGFRFTSPTKPTTPQGVSRFRTERVELDSSSAVALPRTTSTNSLLPPRAVAAAAVLAAWLLTSSSTGSLPSSSSSHPHRTVLQNNVFHYGTYCGPGPADTFGAGPPADAVDQVCQVASPLFASRPFAPSPLDHLFSNATHMPPQAHDVQYRYCLDDLRSAVHPVPVPRGINQLAAIRGLLPPPLATVFHGGTLPPTPVPLLAAQMDPYSRPCRPFIGCLAAVLPRYAACVHDADAAFVRGLRLVEANRLEPAWWADPTRAPSNAEGAAGFREACALAMPAPPTGGGGLGAWLGVGPAAAAAAAPAAVTDGASSPLVPPRLCLLSSRSVFISGALQLFDTALHADQQQQEQPGQGQRGADGSGKGLWGDVAAAAALSTLPLSHHGSPSPPCPPPSPPTAPGPDPFLFMRPFAAAAATADATADSARPGDSVTVVAQQQPIPTILFFRD